MIEVTGIDNKEFVLNAEHIEKIEEVPETVITLVNNKKYLVLETADEVVRKVIQYKNKIYTMKL